MTPKTQRASFKRRSRISDNEFSIPVAGGYRLDLTATALQRTSVNAVDRIDNGHYVRAFDDSSGVWVVEVEQTGASSIHVRTSRAASQVARDRITAMLGTAVDLSQWNHSTKAVPWLHHLAARLRGIRPPRYPTVWEALCNAVVFQQISLIAASAIMHRLVVRYSPVIRRGADALYPFPQAAAIASAPAEELRTLGLSGQKAAFVRAIGAKCSNSPLDAAALRDMPLEEAVALLCELPGIGAWSAAVVLLRGCGRLDIFPRGDSGARAAVRALSNGADSDPDVVASRLGSQRGMLYFHLLLGRLQTTGVTN